MCEDLSTAPGMQTAPNIWPTSILAELDFCYCDKTFIKRGSWSQNFQSRVTRPVSALNILVTKSRGGLFDSCQEESRGRQEAVRPPKPLSRACHPQTNFLP